MADTTVEIFNDTIQWGNYSSNLQTLFTTDANTRYVIKDVELDANSYGSNPPSLLINNTKVATLSGNLAGSEIVDVSSTVSIYANAAGQYVNISTYDPGTPQFYNGLANGVEFVGDGSLSAFPDSMNSPTSVSLSGSSSARSFWNINGDFYYFYWDGNSTAALLKRPGGVTGSEVTICSNSYTPVAFDGVSKFYWVNPSAQLYVYDTATGVASYVRNMNWGGTSYPKLVYCAGFLIWSPSNSGYPWAYYHIASGTFNASGSPSYSSYTGWVAFYDSSASTIRIVHLPYTGGGSSSYYYDDFQVNGTNLSWSGQGSNSIPNGYQFAATTMSSLGGKYALMLGSNSNSADYGKMFIVDKTMAVVASKTITNANFISGRGSSYQVIASPTTAQKNAAGPSVKLRITGVKQV